MASEMVERVARVLCKVGCGRCDGDWRCLDGDCEDFGEWLSEARAAIAAMREPTEAMLAATLTGFGAEVWRDMIDEALRD